MLLISIFFLSVERIFSTLSVYNPIQDIYLERFESFEYSLPYDLFDNTENSRVYISTAQNKWIRPSYSNPTIENSYFYVRGEAVFVSGGYCYISDDLGESVRILDVSDPLNPDIVGTISLDYGEYIQSIFVLGNNAFITNGDSGSGNSRLYIVDVSEKSSPFVISSVEIENGNDVYVDDKNYLYLADGSAGLKIYDISNLVEISLELTFDEFTFARGLDISDNYCYVTNSYNGFKIYDVSDPPNTNLVSSLDNCTRAQSLAVKDNYLYIADEISGLKIFNVTNKQEPNLVGSCGVKLSARDIFLLGDYVFVADFGFLGGLNMIYAADKTYPFSCGLYPLPEASSVVLDGLDAYVMDKIEGIHIIDISIPWVPVLLSNPYSGRDAKKIFLQDEYLYVADESGGLNIFNIQEEFSSTKVGSLNLTNAHDVFVKDDYCYVGDLTAGLYVIDISDKSSPEIVGILDIPYSIEFGVYVDDRHLAYVTDGSSLSIVDVSNVYLPVTLETLPLEGAVSAFVDENTTFVCLSTEFGNKGIMVVDTSDPFDHNITSLHYYEYGRSSCFVSLGDGHAYVCESNVGIKIVDVSNTSNIVTEGDVTTRNARNIFIQENQQLFVADSTNGLIIVDVQNPEFPVIVDSVDTYDASDVFVRDNYVFLADSLYGIKIMETDLKLEGSSEFEYFCGETSVTISATDGSETIHHNFKIFRDDYCSGRGTCKKNFKCSCSKGYIGDQCDTWNCGFDFKDVSRTCNGRGDCVGPNECDCNGGYVGELCDTNILLSTVMAPILTLSGIVAILIAASFCCFLLLLCFCGIIVLFCCLCLCFGVVVKQTHGLKKFGKLRNFDLLLREQEVDDDTSIAHMRVNRKLFEIEFDEVKVESILGEGGSNSTVFLASWHNQRIAFKCFKTRTLCSSQNSFDEFEREVEILGSLSHPNIIRFFGASLKVPRVGILMEFCSNGELLECIEKFGEEEGIPYPVEERIRMVMEIASSMAYIHQRSIIHRDLKCENVLVDEKYTTRLMDFGLSRAVENMEVNKTKRIGTNIYMAPEVSLSGKYDEKCDVFSYGILLWVVFAENNNPYGTNDLNIEMKVANNPDCRPDLKEMDKILTNKYNWIRNIAKKCWAHDSKEREDFQRIHALLSSNLERTRSGSAAPVELLEDDGSIVTDNGGSNLVKVEDQQEDRNGDNDLERKLVVMEEELDRVKLKNRELEKRNQELEKKVNGT